MVILELIHAQKFRLVREETHLLDQDQWGSGPSVKVTLDNCANRMALAPAMNLSSVCLINFRW